MTNISTATDFYKVGHIDQYPQELVFLQSNFTPRSGKLQNVPVNGIIFFGLSYFCKKYLTEEWDKNFFNRPKEEVLEKYSNRISTSLGITKNPDHISKLHDLGYLPIYVKAVPEGSLVKYGVPALVIENTVPGYHWLVNYLETLLSNYLWMPCTSATTAAYYREVMEHYAKETCSDNSHIDFQGHDFSFRGMATLEAAALSGAGHLLSFKGTDTIPAIDLLEDYYNAKTPIAFSVPASEHSVMSSYGKVDEFLTFKRFVTELYPNGIVSIVSDTWDLWKVLTDYLPNLQNEILKREGKVVIRPDSGNPADIICGEVIDITDEYGFLYVNLDELALIADDFNLKDGNVIRANGHYYKVSAEYEPYDYYWFNYSLTQIEPEPKHKGVLQLLWETFGGTVNDKGYKVLNPKIGCIYGDSISPTRLHEILKRMKEMGFASSNIVLGLGSYTYQYVTRDTHGFAVKATWAKDSFGNERFLSKDPITDKGSVKKSLTGKVSCVNGRAVSGLSEEDEYVLRGSDDYLTYFYNGLRNDDISYEDIVKHKQLNNLTDFIKHEGV